MGCPRNLLYGRGLKVNTAAKALPILAARPDPGRRGYAWAAVLTYSPRPFTIFRGQPIPNIWPMVWARGLIFWSESTKFKISAQWAVSKIY